MENLDVIEEIEIVQIDLKAMQSLLKRDEQHQYTVTPGIFTTDNEHHHGLLGQQSTIKSDDQHQQPPASASSTSSSTATINPLSSNPHTKQQEVNESLINSISSLITNQLASFETKLTHTILTSQSNFNSVANRRFIRIEKQLETIQKNLKQLLCTSLPRKAKPAMRHHHGLAVSVRGTRSNLSSSSTNSKYNFFNDHKKEETIDDDDEDDDSQNSPEEMQVVVDLEEEGDENNNNDNDSDPDYFQDLDSGGDDNEEVDDDDGDFEDSTIRPTQAPPRPSPSTRSASTRNKTAPKNPQDPPEEFACAYPECSATFPTQRIYAAHYYNVHLALFNPTKCLLCKKVSPTLEAHEAHLADTHPDSEQLIQDKLVELSDVRKTYCSLCSKDFASKVEFHKHCNGEHRSCLKAFTCKSCLQGFYSATKLARHYTEVHRDEEVVVIPMSEGAGGDGDNNNPIKNTIVRITRRIPCSVCKKTFLRSADLARHVKLHSGITFDCKYCGKVCKRKDTLKDHQAEMCKKIPPGLRPAPRVRIPPEQRSISAQCSDCSASFKNKTLLERHTLLVHGHNPYHCALCNKYFTKYAGLLEHNEGCHEKITKYLCTICGKSFCRRRSYGHHVQKCQGVDGRSARRKHYDMLICLECNEPRKFSSIESLKRHKLIHTGDKPYTCDVCGCQFRRKYVMMKHKMENCKGSTRRSSKKT